MQKNRKKIKKNHKKCDILIIFNKRKLKTENKKSKEF